MVQIGQYVQTVYDFHGETASDLSLTVGDVVKVTDVVDEGWVTGSKVGGNSESSGNFPRAFVEPLVLPSIRTGQKLFLALQDFPADQIGDLELTKGDILVGTEAVDESWWRGKSGPLKGIFPLTFVAELEQDDGPRSRSASARSGSLKSRSSSLNSHVESVHDGITRVSEVFARALVGVSPQLDGELAFQAGDLIEITEILDDDWMYGRCRNKEGLVSAVCVELLEDDSGGDKVVNSAFSLSSETGSVPLRPDQTSNMAGVGSRPSSAGEDYRGRNSSNGSYTSENTRSHDAEITPYGRILYSFTAQLPTELSVSENQIVTLIKHVDADWTEGEVDGRRGLFPTGFMEVIVDCPYAYNDSQMYSSQLESDLESTKLHSSVENYENVEAKQFLQRETDESQQNGFLSAGDAASEDVGSLPVITASVVGKVELSSSVVNEAAEASHEIGLVLHAFTAEVSGDVSVSEGDTVEVIRQVDENWLEVQTEAGLTGLVPRNHVEIIGPWPKVDSRSGSVSSDSTSAPVPPVDSAITQPSGPQESSFSPDPPGAVDNSSQAKALESESHRAAGSILSMISDPKSQITTSSNLEGAISEASSFEGSGISEKKLDPLSEGLEHEKQPEIDSGLCLASQKAENRKVSSGQKVERTYTPRRPAPVAKSQPPLPSTTPNMGLRRQSLPPRDKPPLLPKPSIAPKPSLAPKPKSFNSPKSFSFSYTSGSAAHPHRAIPPSEKPGDGLRVLDTLIEGEIEKAKSRTSSQSSDALSDVSSSSAGVATTLTSGQKASSVSLPPTTPSVSTQWNSSGEKNVIMNSFDPLSSPVVSQSPVRNQPQHPSGASSRRGLLAPSLSMNDADIGNSSDSDRRRSASYTERSKVPQRADCNSSVKEHPSQGAAFVNKAFQMEVDEGNLLRLGTTRPPPPSRPPTRAPPPRPVSSVSVDTPAFSAKLKAPPPRPTGPRMASAPSKTPLVPVKVESRPKPVPLRSAPKPPVPGTQNVALAENKDANNVNNSSVTAPPPPMTMQVPRRQPPRPQSFPAPPKRPPPRPADLISFSPEGHTQEIEEEDDETKKEMIADLKAKLDENQADIKKYEQTRGDLQASLCRAEDATKEEETRDNLDFVSSTLVGLREEERSLKENLFALSPQEARLEKARLLAAQHAEEEERRKEEERKKAEEMKEKHREQRAKVIDEILETEKDYLVSLQLCWETFLDGQEPPSGVDLHFLLGNMEEIADVSQKLLVNLETCVAGKTFEEQTVGKCFTFFAEDMKNTYAPYCRNHDDVITAMERYSENPSIGDYFNLKLETMREQMNVFDVAGMLIKPVQRILKYPLFLNELLKNTEDGHPDKEDIVLAIKAMTDVAKAINEYKRRKDLVYKYKKFSDQTFSDKISKLNLHSIKKKSSRIRGRLSTNFGIALQCRDEAFEREEARFRSLEKAVRIFQRSVQQYMEQSQEAMRCQESVVEDISDFYRDKECVEVTRYKAVSGKFLDLYENMRKTIEEVVMEPLNSLIALFNAPSHVIEKRFDKLLDYNYQLGKTENDKELQAAKNDYEAMNAQLLDELPKFYSVAFTLLRHFVAAFVLARRDFMDQALRESCALLELPSILGKSNMMETFNIRHTTAFDHMSLMSFIPRGFNPRVDTVKADRARQRGKGMATESQQQTTSPGSQSESQRAYLRQQFVPSKLFTVTSTHNAVDLMDISLTEGTLVGVVKELDPMGNKERWFVDDGVTKGFAPSSILTQASASPPGSQSHLVVDDDVLSVHSYDSGGGGSDNISINDGGRVTYTASSPPGASGGSGDHAATSQQEPEAPQYQYYYALYNFEARHQNEACLTAGHPVTVLAFQDVDGNSEWWLVDSGGTRGYAPANYMAPMPYS